MTFDPGWSRQPRRRLLHVPQAAQTAISEVVINDQPVALAADATVELPIVERVVVSGRFL